MLTQVTEFNIYISLLIAFLLVTFSIRLGVSLFQSS